MVYIIIPVKNENNLRRTADRLVNWSHAHLKDNFEILIIDDHSDDNIIRPLEKLGYSHLRIVKNTENPGKGSALKCAYNKAKLNYQMKDDDIIIFMDGDGQIELDSITTLLYLSNFSRVVVGNKRHALSQVAYSPVRSVVSRTYNFIVRFLFDLDITDTQCGIKLFRKKDLDRVIDKVSVEKFAFDLELLIALKENGYTIQSAPITVHRQMNFGSVNIKSILQTLWDTLIILKKYKKNVYKSKI